MHFLKLLAAAVSIPVAYASTGLLQFTGETGDIAIGKTMNIQYSAPSMDLPVTILLKNNEGLIPTVVATLTTSSLGGSFLWTVPKTLASGSHYCLEITQGQDTCETDEFSITGILDLPGVPAASSLTKAPKVPAVSDVLDVTDATDLHGLPKVPDVKGVPSVPAVSEVTSVPSVPAVPAVTGVPSVPAVQAVTGVPNVSGVPKVSDIPKVPGAPKIPAVPVASTLLKSVKKLHAAPVSVKPRSVQVPGVPVITPAPMHHIRVPIFNAASVGTGTPIPRNTTFVSPTLQPTTVPAPAPTPAPPVVTPAPGAGSSTSVKLHLSALVAVLLAAFMA